MDALIVGAGPAGCAAAIHLARTGYEVLIVERCRFPRIKPCGEYYNPECCRLLRQLGVMPALTGAGAVAVPALVLGSSDGCGLTVPFGSLENSSEPALSLGREVLDMLLLQTARRAGAEVWEGATVREPLLDPCGQVAGAVVTVDGRNREVRAGITLAADGLRSRFARRLGLGRGDGGRRRFGITARYAAAGSPDAVEMRAGAPGCCGLVVRGEEANLGMVADGTRAREIGGDPASFFQSELRGFPDLARRLRGDPLAVRTAGPLTWITRRQSAAGCLLLGDAAGFYDPFTGQGVTFALLTAQLAAEVAAAALEERDLSERRLREYSRRRHEMLAPRVRVQQAIQFVMERPLIRDAVLRRLGSRPDLARSLVGVVADVLPASHVLRPGFLAHLLY